MSRQNRSRRNSLSRKSYESLPFRSDSPESRLDDHEDRISSRYVDGTGNRGETRRRYSIQESNRRRDNLESHHSQSRPYGLNRYSDNRDRRSSSCDKQCQQRSETNSRPRERLDRRSSCRDVLHRSSHHSGDRHERREGRRSNLNSEAERRRREQRAREDRERRFSRSAADFDSKARRRDLDRRQERRMSKSEMYSRSDFDIHQISTHEAKEERERSRRDRRREHCTFSKSDNGLDFNDDGEHRRDRERTHKTEQEAELRDKVNQILDQISHMKVKSDLENKSNDRNKNDSHQSVGSKGSKISHQSQCRQSTGRDKVVAESACTSPTAASSIANSTISSLGQSAHFEAEFLASIRNFNENEEDQDLGSLVNSNSHEHFIEQKKGAPSAVAKSAPVTPVASKHKELALTEEDLVSLLDVTSQDHVVETKKGSGDDALASLKSKLLNSRPFKSKESVSADKTQCRKVSEFSLFLKKKHQDCKSPAVTPTSQTKPHAAISATGILRPTTTPPPPQKKIGSFAPLRKSNSQPTEKRVESAVVPPTRGNVPPPPPLARRPMHPTRTGAVPPPPPPPLTRRPLDTRCTPALVQNSHQAPKATASLKKNVPTPPPPSRDANNKSSKVPPPQAKSAPTTPVPSPPVQPKPTIQPEQKTKLINSINNRRQKHVTNMPHTDQFGEFGFYTGEVDEDVRPHGQGKMKYENGVFFEGKWKNGNQDSSAVLQRERMLSGFTSWRGVQKKEASGGNAACHVYGMAWIDNSGLSGKYTGKVNDKNLPHGMGKMIYDMGLIAEGEWVHGVLNGAAQNGPMMGAGATVVPGGTVIGGGMSVLGGGGMSVFPGMTIMGGMQPQAPGMCFEMNPPSAMEIPATISVQQDHEKNSGSSGGPQGSIVFC